MEKKYQVFISSTYMDLAEERAKVRDAILSMYHFPVGMELFGAANEEQWQIIRETIDSSDYYVLVIAQRYGSVIPEDLSDGGISYTEKEFRYALEKEIPILAFILDDSVPVKPEFIEKDNAEKLMSFKQAVKNGRLVEFWKTPDELAQKVTTSLYKQISRTKRPGWIRGDAIDVAMSLRTITELTERNRDLEEQNRILRRKALENEMARKPKLTISIKGESCDGHNNEPLYSRNDNITVDSDECIHLKVGCVSTNSIECEYRPLNSRDFGSSLYGSVTDDEIEAYNSGLPDEAELLKYIEEYRYYHMIVDHGIACSITVHNVGEAKANDVSVIIEFPDEIRVFDIDDIEKLSSPKAPQKAMDLQRIAYDRVHPKEVANRNMYEQLAKLALAKSPNSYKLPTVSIRNTIYESVDISDNTVSIETRRGIVHTKSDSFSGIYMVPLKKGEFKAIAKVMCAEYKEPEEMLLRFICQ